MIVNEISLVIQNIISFFQSLFLIFNPEIKTAFPFHASANNYSEMTVINTRDSTFLKTKMITL